MAVDPMFSTSEPPTTLHKPEADHSSDADDDLSSRLKSLQRQLEFIEIQEEVKRIQSVPLVIGQFMEMIDQNNANAINCELLRPSASFALHRAESSVALLSQSEKPDVTYNINDIGGCDIQKQEIREAVELPLIHHELYTQIGIDPPRGVLLYGPPGTGKTMLAKAVANHATTAFIRVVGSEFVQKCLGEGPRMVRDVFHLAKENAPAIIFIDEVDATARFDAQTRADREVPCILMELLNQMDGFDHTVNVKVIMATNRVDTFDPAVLRPGRLDRKIEFPLPDRGQKRLVFQDIGGCDIQKQEIREAGDLPLTHHELYTQIDIYPPRVVLLYGPPGTGKTMLAQAVANHTTAAFIIVGSEFVQKYSVVLVWFVMFFVSLKKMHLQLFSLMRDIATPKMDGFDQTVNVKVIMATNCADTLVSALLRPGRLDRKIEFPLPDRRQKRLVFQSLHCQNELNDEVDLENYVSRPDKISAAEITAMCQEAGMLAVRNDTSQRFREVLQI
ncbi:26s proteasome regulatory subunit 6B [Castilleja foliolosa]|uniref:26s proteasome regulatory subunit 6B n=1 Tax=Castilleja foliolosa TaxID=1961234 RepID=A0ABD3E3Z2_9LAMI